jgi:hypothetical protein
MPNKFTLKSLSFDKTTLESSEYATLVVTYDGVDIQLKISPEGVLAEPLTKEGEFTDTDAWEGFYWSEVLPVDDSEEDNNEADDGYHLPF